MLAELNGVLAWLGLGAQTLRMIGADVRHCEGSWLRREAAESDGRY